MFCKCINAFIWLEIREDMNAWKNNHTNWRCKLPCWCLNCIRSQLCPPGLHKEILRQKGSVYKETWGTDCTSARNRNSLIFWCNSDWVAALTFLSVKNDDIVNSQGPVRGFLCVKSGLSVTLNLQLHFKLHLYYSLIEVCIRFPTNTTFSCYTISIIIRTIYTFIPLRSCVICFRITRSFDNSCNS